MGPNFDELSVELTHRCALSCTYCSSRAVIDAQVSINLNRLEDVLLEVQKKYGTRTVSLSGGETFLYPKFWDLYSFLVSSQFNIIIYSSGVTLDRAGNRISVPASVLNRLAASGNNIKVFLNIQGHNQQVVEEINATPGSYALITQTAENVLAAGIYLGAHVVPFKTNFRYLEEILQFCVDTSFNEVRFLRFVPQGRGAGSVFYNTPEEFREIDERLRHILQVARDKKFNTKVTLGHPIDFLFLTNNEDLHPEQCRYCRGGANAPLVLPTGYVSMCPAWKDLPEFSAGNIYTSDFEQIWQSPLFLKFRDFVSHGYRLLGNPCGACPHLETCRGKCVAQRLLAARLVNPNGSLDEWLLHCPDPQCFGGLTST